jgi:NitT/TauT family transport system permease protein
MKKLDHESLVINTWRAAVLISCFIMWEWGFNLQKYAAWLVPDLLDPYFISRPTEIWQRYLRMACLTDRNGLWLPSVAGGISECTAANENNLWIATLVTLKNTFWGFLVGVSSGFAVGLGLGRSERMAKIFEPFIVALNCVPRIALVPLIVLMFGLGDASKIMTAWVIVFFLVFFNTFEGVKQVERDYVSVSRLLGASSWQITFKVIVPSALAWLFASLTPAISFSLIGVIVGEFIGAERGLGRIIIEAEGRGDAAAMMVAIFVLMVVGVILAALIHLLQRYLLRWQSTL